MPSNITAPVPTSKSSDRAIDDFNKQLRYSDLWQNFLTSRGLPTDHRLKLNDQQRKELTEELRRHGITVPKDMEVDRAGNFDTKGMSVKKKILLAAAIGGAAALTGGAALGAFGGAGAAGAGAGAAGAGAAGAGAAGAGGGLLAASTLAPMSAFAAPVASGLGAAGTAGALGATAAGVGAGVGAAGAGAGAAGAGAAGGAAAGGAMMPSWVMPALQGGSSAISSIYNAKQERDARRESTEADMAIEGSRDARERELEILRTQLEESQGDPYAHVLAQAAASAYLDRLARQQPRQHGAATVQRYGQYLPTGGYEPSQDLRSAAEVMRNQVISGRGVNPSVTDPNSPRFGVIDATNPAPNTGPVGGTRPSTAPWGGPSASAGQAPAPAPASTPRSPQANPLSMSFERSMGATPGRNTAMATSAAPTAAGMATSPATAPGLDPETLTLLTEMKTAGMGGRRPLPRRTPPRRNPMALSFA